MKTYIYIDESGDLGFKNLGKKGCSTFFTVAALKANTDELNNRIGRIPKRVRQKHLKKKEKLRNEFKFSKSSVETRKRFLKDIMKIDNLRMYSITIDKRSVDSNYFLKKPIILYSFLMRELIQRCLSGKRKKNARPGRLCFDKYVPYSLIEEFEGYVIFSDKVKKQITNIPKIEITHEDSVRVPAIQVVEFIVGAVNTKYERNNEMYFDIIKNKINHHLYFR